MILWQMYSENDVPNFIRMFRVLWEIIWKTFWSLFRTHCRSRGRTVYRYASTGKHCDLDLWTM